MSNDRALTAEEVAVLQEPAPTQEPDVKAVPIDIHTKSSGTFRVPAADSWGYMEQGIFATGFFNGLGWDSDVRDVLIPYDEVRVIQFYFEQQGQEQDGEPGD